MKSGKDSDEVVKFMVLFQKLRDVIADDPTDLAIRAAVDEMLKRLCIDLNFAAFFLSMNERRQRRLFSAPVDPNFIAAWRAYEESYESPISRVFLADLDFGSGVSADNNNSRADFLWEKADDEAKDQAEAIEGALDFAFEQATGDFRDFGDGFRESIEKGTSRCFPKTHTGTIRAYSKACFSAPRPYRKAIAAYAPSTGS